MSTIAPPPTKRVKGNNDESSLPSPSRKRQHEDKEVMITTQLLTTPSALHSPEIISTMLAAQDRRGNAATIILRVVQHDEVEPRFVLQLKTPGYPYETMVGSYCLFGGNKEPTDDSARDTLMRECMEELPTSWCTEIERTLRPFSRFVVTASREACAPKPFSYAFLCTVFEATLPLDLVVGTDSTQILEGKFELITLSQLVGDATPKWCWGYDVVLTSFLREVLFMSNPMKLPKERTDYVRCDAQRIAAECELLNEKWAEKEEWR